jgi:hypothetical protein
VEDDDCNAPLDDLEKGLPKQGTSSNNGSGAPGDNTMNEEGNNAASASGVVPTGHGDADMEFVSGSSLPPIDDRKAKHLDKATQKAAREMEEC